MAAQNDKKSFEMCIQTTSGYFVKSGEKQFSFRPFTTSDKALWVDGQLFHHVETKGDFIKTIKVKKYFVIKRGDNTRFEEFPENGDSIIEKLSIVLARMAEGQKKRTTK